MVDTIVAQWERIEFAPICAALESIRAARSDPEVYFSEDGRFRREMVCRAGNAMLVRMMDAFQLPMRHQIDAEVQKHLVVATNFSRSFKADEVLFDALKHGDLETARRTIQRMINSSTTIL